MPVALVMGVSLVDFSLGTGKIIALGPNDIVFPEDYVDPVNTMPRRVSQISVGRVLFGGSKIYMFDPDDAALYPRGGT